MSAAPVPATAVAWSRAEADAAEALLDLERRANLVGLAHVFPADRFTFPDVAVLDRWRSLLADPAVTVDVVRTVGSDRLRAVAAYDGDRLRHLAVDPDHWGAGLGRAGVERAVAAIRARGRVPRLWCLADNHRARALYARLGWRPTGVERPAPFPPHPTEQEHVLADRDDRRPMTEDR